LFLHRFSGDYGARSVFYSLAIIPLHWGTATWLVVAMQCLLVAWVVWLVVRSIAPRSGVLGYMSLILSLSLLSSAGWYAAFIMPDILAPVLCLAIYLLAYAGDALSRMERIALGAVAWWSITAHATHLLLACGLCLLLAAAAAFERKRHSGNCRAGDFKAVGLVAVIVVAAVASQLAVYGLLYGTPSLNGRHPPILMARVIADGPGRWYLEQHCPQVHWAVCDHLPSLSADPNTLLWGSDAPYEPATESEKRRFEAEEMPLVLATLRAYPWQEFTRAAANFRDQLRWFGLFGFNWNERMPELLNAAMPQLTSSYLRSRQARDALHLVPLSRLEWWVIVASLAVIAGLAPFSLRRASCRLAGLSLVIAATVIGNACITGVLSQPNHRFQCRVMWLVPFLAGVLLLDWLARWKAKGQLPSQIHR
jgi:hypothetical protein